MIHANFLNRSGDVSVVLRLFATIAIIFLLSGVGGSLIGYREARERIAEEMNAAMTVGRETAHRSVVALASSFRPEGHLTEFVSLFDGDRHLRARLSGADGRLIKQSMPLSPRRHVPAWFSHLIGAEPQVEKVALPEPLSRLATLTIETVPDNEIEEVWSSFLLAAGILAMFMALVLSLVALVVWHSLRPIKPLLAALDKVGTVDAVPAIQPSGPPELRQLHAGFNGMAARLEAMERRNASLSAQIATVQEEERADLARDLHDEVGPQLFAIDVDASAIRSMAAKKPCGKETEIAARAGAISASAVAIKQQVRAILARLRPNLAADIGLEQAIIDLVAAEQERHPAIRFEEDLAVDCRDPVASAALFAVAREAIHNALRHAAPRTIRLALLPARAGGIELTVENDGGSRQPVLPGSHGLRNMRERMEALGGRFAVEDVAEPPGVRVRAYVPRIETVTSVKEEA